MNVEIGTESGQFPGKKYINGIFFAVQHVIRPISRWFRLIWSMDAGRLSLTLCEDTVEEEEQNIITGTLHLK
jgi:hypothetical protein